jgi:hypothetical protein
MPAAVDESTESARWSDLRCAVAAVVWSSFLAASFATMVFFACFDPLELGNDLDPPRFVVGRMSGYGIGFFFFWVVTLIASTLTAFLVSNRGDSRLPDTARDRAGNAP